MERLDIFAGVYEVQERVHVRGGFFCILDIEASSGFSTLTLFTHGTLSALLAVCLLRISTMYYDTLPQHFECDFFVPYALQIFPIRVRPRRQVYLLLQPLRRFTSSSLRL